MHKIRSVFIFLTLLTGILLSRACVADPLGIPLMKGVQIDGDTSDWGAAGFRISLFSNSSGKTDTSLNSKDSVRLGWDNRGLLALFQVADVTPKESQETNGLWQGTSVELLMADHIGGRNSVHLLISPGLTPEHPNLRFFFYDNRKDVSLKIIPLTQVSARKATKTGYIIEALLPWKDLNIKPEIGVQLGAQIMINHLDSAGRSNTLMWYPKTGADSNTTIMCPILLSKEAGQDKSFVAFAEAGSIWPEKIVVVGDARLAGRKVTAVSGSQILAQSTMQPASGRSLASLSVPATQGSQVDKPVNLVVEGEEYQQVATSASVTQAILDTPVTLANSLSKTPGVLGEASLVFNPFVFSGNTFPDCDFENWSQIRSLIGDYTITRRFFNANYEEVTQADKPGRYGAIVKIVSSAKGLSTERYVTIFRQKDQVDWSNARLSESLNLPEGMGVDLRVCKEQSKTIDDLVKRALLDRLSKESDGAVAMAGLSETAAGNGPCTSRNDVWTLDDHWWYGLLKKLNKNTLYHYSAYLPKDYSTDGNKRWPLLIVLHGSGERGATDQHLQENSAFAPMLEYTKDKYPMITVIPHCPEDQEWEGVIIKDIIETLNAQYRIDPKRIYLTGYSMGGFGTFLAAAEYPDLFAAIAPICGGGDPSDAVSYRNLPVWAFHGDKDPSVPMQESVQMVDAIRKAGGDAKLTLYPGVGHISWEATFKNPALYEWFLSHSK